MVGVCRPGNGEAVREECGDGEVGMAPAMRRGENLSKVIVPGESSESSSPFGVSMLRTYALLSGRAVGETEGPWLPLACPSWLPRVTVVEGGGIATRGVM